jgi:TonB family protein
VSSARICEPRPETEHVTTMLKKAAGISAAALLTILPLAATTAPAGAAQDVGLATSCEVPNAPASTTYGAVPAIPVIAANLDLTGTTFVQVDVAADGTLLNATVAKPSGTPLLDRAAIQAARESSFQPEIRDCLPVAGSYLFEVDFPE